MHTIKSLFGSLKVAIFLFVLLSIISVAGTLVPQHRGYAEYVSRFPTTWKYILALGFDDLYNSHLFLGTLVLLSISTLVCTIIRFRIVRQKILKRLSRAGVKEISSLPLRKSFDAQLAVQPVGFDKKKTEDGHEILFRPTGRLSLIGGLSIHLGFLLILLGGLWGAVSRVEMAVVGTKGAKVAIPPLEAIRAAARSDEIRRKARMVQARDHHDPILEVFKGQIMELDDQFHQGQHNPQFRVAFNDLSVDYHPPVSPGAFPAVKSWNSTIEIVDSKHQSGLASAVVRVNQPFDYHGYTFYQSNWNRIYRTVHLEVTLADSKQKPEELSPAQFPQKLTLTAGVPVKPSWSPYVFQLVEFFPDLRIMGEGHFVTVSDNLNNPAGIILAYDDTGAEIDRTWAFGPQMMTMARHVSKIPFVFLFKSADVEYESGLQMTFDPGIPIVWLGCIIMTLGLLLSFYLPYSEEWAVFTPAGTVVISVAGNRPRPVMEEWLSGLEHKIIKA